MTNTDKPMPSSLAIIAVLGFSALLMPSSEESIQRCAENSNYAQERCELEITL